MCAGGSRGVRGDGLGGGSWGGDCPSRSDGEGWVDVVWLGGGVYCDDVWDYLDVVELLLFIVLIIVINQLLRFYRIW